MILWCDVETTGLIPDDGLLLEVAAVLTDDQLTVLGSGSWVVDHPPETIAAVIGFVDPRVLEMHTNNGLWRDLLDPTCPNRATGEQIVAAAAGIVGGRKSLPLGGFSPHFDRGWLTHHLPGVLAGCNHRCFDASTLKHAVRETFGDWGPAKSEVAHRALPDTLEAIAYYRWFREHCLVRSHGAA